MSGLKTNRELAQEISARIGNAPIPFDSIYSICLEIYNELGGEPAEFDSVYSILLETLPLAESIAKKTSITEVDELADAQDNNNIYRLSSDDKVYMSKHVSTDYTNRLPDDEQIDKAYLKDGSHLPYVYKGFYKVICSDGEINGYGWYTHDEEFWYMQISEVDAVHITTNDNVYTFTEEEMTNIILDEENKTITALDYTLTELQEDWYESLNGMSLYPIPAIYNAPEADCIGNAMFGVDGDTMIYTGEEATIEIDGKTITVYKWYGNGWYIGSTKRASEIYYKNEGDEIYVDTIFYDLGENVVWDEMLDMYIPQLNAPDSEQVGKASLNNASTEEVYCYYVGIEKTVVLADRTFNVYLWGDDEELPDDWYYTTLKPANQIHGGSDLIADGFDGFGGWVVDGNTVTNTGITYDEFADECIHSITDAGLSVHTVPYQRAIENWEWKQIPTMDDIPQSTEYHAGQNISIDASNNISAEGYVFNTSKGNFALYYFDEDEGEMMLNVASGEFGAFAEGYGTTAEGGYGAHAEGCATTAHGEYGAHAEGQLTTASGIASHAEGFQTSASGECSHAEGYKTQTNAQNRAEHAEGNYNVSHHTANSSQGNTQHSIGIGWNNNRKNAFEVMQNGDAYVFGIGGYQGVDTKVQNASIMTVQDYVSARETYVDTNFAKVVSLTQDQYDALTTKDAHTLYIISDAQ